MEQCHGQVFWLVDRPTRHAFPSPKVVDSGSFPWLSSPLTAAGPRRILAVFPAPKHFSIVRLLYTLEGLFCQYLYIRIFLIFRRFVRVSPWPASVL
jgi:hypothetical protein